MQRLLLASLLAVLSSAALGQTTFTIGPNDVAAGTIPTMETTHAYFLDVGPRVERLVIAVDGEGQDADLAVYLGDDEVFYDASGAESATYDVRDPSAGRYRIEVLNLLFQELSYTLTTSTRTSGATGGTPAPPATTAPDRGEIELGGQRESLASASGSWQTYVLRVPRGTPGFTVQVDAAGHNVDLAVRFRDVEIFRDVSTNPYPLFRLPTPAAGTYLLSVRSSTGRDAPYRIRVEGSAATVTTPAPAPAPPAEPSTPVPAPEPPPAHSGPSDPSASAWRHDFATGELLGWSVENGSLANPGRGGPGGGGYLYADTPSDREVGYFVAPASLLGDWSSLTSLEIVLRHGPTYEGSTFGPYEYDGVGDVLLVSGSRSASYAFSRDVTRSWSSYEVALDDASRWRLGGGAESLSDVLRDVTAFAVRAEYLVGHADAGMASVEAFRGRATGAGGASGPATGTTTGATPSEDGYPLVRATCTTTAEAGAFGELLEGERIGVNCPDECWDGGGTIWGDGVYTDDSAICRALFHSGRVTPGADLYGMLLTILPGQERYEGAERNGIESRSYGRWPRSFAFGLGPFPTTPGDTAGGAQPGSPSSPPGTAALRVLTGNVAVGRPFTAEFRGAPGNAQDWIGLYSVGAGDREYWRWKYTEGATAGTLEFEAPDEPGRYELRMFEDNEYDRLATSDPFDVAP